MDFPSDPKPSPRQVQLQGPRPTPLNVSKDSHKIRKPPVAPGHHHHHHPPPSQQQQQPPHPPRAPVIIYTVSPKIIHADPGDFMTLVQRLTGRSPTSLGPGPAGALSPAPAGPLSPAARFAAIERGCPPTDPYRPPPSADVEDVADQLGILSAALDVGNLLPGILSPLPSSLPSIPANYFSPPPSACDLGSLTFLNEMSPVFRGSRGFMDGGPFLPSPGNALFTPTLPSPGALWDLLGQL